MEGTQGQFAMLFTTFPNLRPFSRFWMLCWRWWEAGARAAVSTHAQRARALRLGALAHMSFASEQGGGEVVAKRGKHTGSSSGDEDFRTFEISDVGSESQVQTWMTSIRRHLHQYPELSWQEEKTSAFVVRHLEHLGLSPRRIAKYGVIADIPGQANGPLIALRGDMDALPVTEQTGLEFASKHPGVMHACGHDGHTSILLGAAAHLMHQVRSGKPPPLPVRLLFQPAEEAG